MCVDLKCKNRSQQFPNYMEFASGINGKRAQSIRVYGTLFREREIEKAKGVPIPCTPVPLLFHKSEIVLENIACDSGQADEDQHQGGKHERSK